MKNMRRVVVSFLVLSMVLIGVLMPNKAYAGNDSDFVIENGILTEYKGSGGDVVIPDGVTAIGGWAFAGCSKLTSVTIPSSVTEIGASAFNGTPWLDKKRKERKDHLVIVNNILIDGEKAQGEITIPDGVTSIGDWAFFSCSSIMSVTIPDSVIAIGDEAFLSCSKLRV